MHQSQSCPWNHRISDLAKNVPSRLSIPQITSTTTFQNFMYCSSGEEIHSTKGYVRVSMASRELGISAAFSRANFKGDRGRACLHACGAWWKWARGIRRLIVQTFHGKTELPGSSDYTTGRTSFWPAKPTPSRPNEIESERNKTDRIDSSITGWWCSGARTREKRDLLTPRVSWPGLNRDWRPTAWLLPSLSLHLDFSVLCLSFFFFVSKFTTAGYVLYCS